MDTSVNLLNINNITISGRIASGASTLAEKLAEKLNWKLFKGGEMFREISKELGTGIVQADKRPDNIDLQYEERIKEILTSSRYNIIESHLAGFDAQGI